MPSFLRSEQEQEKNVSGDMGKKYTYDQADSLR